MPTRLTLSTAQDAVRTDPGPGGPHEVYAAGIVTAAEEILARAPWFWLEVLFVIETSFVGPRRFERAFELNIISSDDEP